MPGKLDGRVAVITGGGSGLGESAAKLFAAEGAKVVIADINVEAGEGVVQALQDSGTEALFVKTDVSSATDARNLMDAAVARFGRIDILINNAGVQVEKAVPETTEEDWDFVLGVNLKGPFLCSKYAIRQMRKQKSGNIVCISSLSGVVSNAEQASYNASKHGLIGLAKCMAHDHALEGIRVNTVCPGSMNTPMLDGVPEEHLAPYRKSNLLERFADPPEVANCILFLVSDDASFVTGSVLVADGGYTTK